MSEETFNQRLQYSGNGTELAGLMFKNLILTILTLGVYSAWGRTHTRRYLWGHVSFLGDRAVYTGTGLELFKGWTQVVILYILIAVAINLLNLFTPAFGLLVFPLYIYIYAQVLYGGTRYRLSRTSWRGVNFGMEKFKKDLNSFISLVFLNVFLSIITLGLNYPFQRVKLRRFLMLRTKFGNKNFSYEADGFEYAKIFFGGLFLSIITLGIYIPWFICSLARYSLEKTRLKDLNFRLHLKGKDLLVFALCSYPLAIVTLGLATPWLLNWFLSLLISSVEASGTFDWEEIQNETSNSDDAAADVAAIEYEVDLGF